MLSFMESLGSAMQPVGRSLVWWCRCGRLAGVWLALFVVGVLPLTVLAQATRTISVEADRNGVVLPGSEVIVADGDDALITFEPFRGFRVGKVVVNGEPLEIDDNQHLFREVRQDYTLEVEFLPGDVRALPFREDFANVEPGAMPLNVEGWYGDPLDLSVEVLQTERRQLVLPPEQVGQAEATTRVMRIFGSSVTQYFDDSDADRIWVDLRMRADLLRHTNVTVEADTQMAFYVNGDGKVVVYHRDLEQGSAVWTELQDTMVAEEEWILLTVLTDYRSLTDGGPFFQIYLNGVLVSDPVGRHNPSLNAPAGGSWFASATPGRRPFGAVTLSGTGYLDEVMIDSKHKGFPERVHTIRSTVAEDGGGEITHAGSYRIPEGWTKIYDFNPEPGHGILDLQVNGEFIGGRPRYVFNNVRQDHTLETVFAPRIDVRWNGQGQVIPHGEVMRRLGQTLDLRVAADEGHHIDGVQARRGLDTEFEPLEAEFGPGVTEFDYAWGAVDGPGAFNADFAVDHHTLVVNSEWGGALLNGRVVTPGVPLRLPWGSPIRLTIEHSPLQLGDQQFVCTGWEGSGSLPAEGRGTDTGELVLKEDSSITWQWREER